MLKYMLMHPTQCHWFEFVCSIAELRRLSGCQSITLWTTALRSWITTEITTTSSCMSMPKLILGCRSRPSKGLTKSQDDNNWKKNTFSFSFCFVFCFCWFSLFSGERNLLELVFDTLIYRLVSEIVRLTLEWSLLKKNKISIVFFLLFFFCGIAVYR